MEENKYVIGIDLDGTTLMDWDGRMNEETNRRIDRVHPLTIEAVKKLQELGHTIVINTGRNWEEAKSIYELLGLNSYIVNSAGSHVHNPSDSSVEEERYGMDPKLVKEILADEKVSKDLAAWMVDNNELVHLCEGACEDFTEKAFKYWDTKWFDGEFDFHPQSGVFYYEGISDEEINNLVLYMRDKWGDEIHFTNWGTTGGSSGGIEINPSRYNKGTGLLSVADKLGVDHKYTMGFGDGENDLELIKMAEHGVAMNHAVDYIKKHAQHVTELTNQEGGVGDFLNKFFNLGL